MRARKQKGLNRIANIIQLLPSVQANIQICQPEGEVVFPQVDKSGCFSTQRAVIVLLYFCQCFIGYLPCGGKLSCSAGNNRVVSQQCKIFANVLQVISLMGEIGLFDGEQQGCFPAVHILGKTSQLFYYHMTNLIQSKSIIQIKI